MSQLSFDEQMSIAMEESRAAEESKKLKAVIAKSLVEYEESKNLEMALAKSLSESEATAKKSISTHNDLYRKVLPVHDMTWVIVGGYPDGSYVVNATYVWPSKRDVVDDIKKGNIVGEAPYCFLITLFHLNRDFFVRRNITSPYALLTYLMKNGMPPPKNQMYEDTTIIPVARHFRATIYIHTVDVPDYSHIINNGHNEILKVSLSLKTRHYISGTEP